VTDERRFDQGGIYHIRVLGTLGDKWADRFDGFALTSRANSQTLLTGPVADQAALYGVLDKIRDLGLPLLLVLQADCPCSKAKCPRRGRCTECAAYHAVKGKLPYCHRPRSNWDKRLTVL
jgi:hypothetical protein